ncbi:plasmid partitioning protein RepB C-terminal domain-containing protein [Oleidesulfovibrio alaskensis]|uniref:plasmid partitioning protein RepB C-terminal domain-containing protein n=1 Tax=Oleidesulfovibrio alaskensis TaxID=58180 RepID=UPI0004069CD7|nr:plasmid partitioning protein RepB C-terminal domain-containing protein [Oleidesulfovibrio alaskensis]
MAKGIKQGFEKELVELAFTDLRLTKNLNVNVKQGRKYSQILSSIREVGLIEPPVVALCNNKKEYLLLDGHLRIMALEDLGEKRVNCLVSVDDEGYTYNKFINRLSAVQEHKMIVKALKAGVSETKLAAALNIDVKSLRGKKGMLDGVCQEAVDLLKDKIMSECVFRVLKKMKPLRQINAARSMNAQNRYSYKYAQSLLVATPADQLLDTAKSKKISQAELEKHIRLEEESFSLTEDIHALHNSYGADMLHLSSIQSYLKRMMSNEKVAGYLSRHHSEIHEKFLEIIGIDFLKMSDIK